MPGRKIQVRLKVPMDPRPVTQLLEEEGFEVDGVIETRGGISNAVDVFSFVVERLDDAVIPILVAVVTKLISRRRSQEPLERGVNFSVTDQHGGNMYVINVTGDGNWVQVHPRPPDEEE